GHRVPGANAAGPRPPRASPCTTQFGHRAGDQPAGGGRGRGRYVALLPLLGGQSALPRQHVLRSASRAKDVDLALPDQYLGRLRVTQELQAADTVAVRTTEEDADDVTRLRQCHLNVRAEHVQRRAAWADQIRLLQRGRRIGADVEDRVRLAEDLPPVPGRADVVVHPAVGHDEGLAPRLL